MLPLYSINKVYSTDLTVLSFNVNSSIALIQTEIDLGC